MVQLTDDFSCIAVDMGAGSIRIMLGMISKQGILYREVHRMENKIIRCDGHECWDMEKIFAEIRTGITKALGSSRTSPVSIGVDSWGVDFVHLDDRGKLLEIPVAYRDNRTEGMRELWGAMMSEPETFRRTGINFYVFNTLFQLLSLKGSELMDRTGSILFIPGYINYLLCGRAGNELTIASTSQMLGLGEAEWDAEILHKLQIERGLLGDVIDPGTLLGKVTLPEAGSAHMQNIAVCGHDTACVVAAIPAESPDYAYVSAGTWCIVGIESEKPLVSEEALQLGFTNERGYNNTFRTVKNIVGLWLLQGLKKSLPEHTTFADLESMTSGGREVSQVIDPDDPRFFNPEDMKEAINSYFRESGQPLPGKFSEYIQCAYDSICFSIRYHIEKLETLSGRKISLLHLVGGGSQSVYLNQRIATVCAREVVSGPVEVATLGNILVQAIAMQRIGDLEEGRGLVRRSFRIDRFQPEPQDRGMDQRYKYFITLKGT